MSIGGKLGKPFLIIAILFGVFPSVAPFTTKSKTAHLIKMKPFLLLLPTLASSFVFPQSTPFRRTPLAAQESSEESSEGDSEGLVLDGLDQQMKTVAASDIDFGQIDFLAAARKRAEEKTASRNAGAGEEEWKNLAAEKKAQFGEIDDWENSMKEAGNMDSQILMFTDPPADDEGEDAEEPKLLLF